MPGETTIDIVQLWRSIWDVMSVIIVQSILRVWHSEDVISVIFVCYYVNFSMNVKMKSIRFSNANTSELDIELLGNRCGICIIAKDSTRNYGAELTTFLPTKQNWECQDVGLCFWWKYLDHYKIFSIMT